MLTPILSQYELNKFSGFYETNAKQNRIRKGRQNACYAALFVALSSFSQFTIKLNLIQTFLLRLTY